MKTTWIYTGILLVTGFALSACGAGKQHQTSSQFHDDGYEFEFEDVEEPDPDELLNTHPDASHTRTAEAERADGDSGYDEFLESSDSSADEPLLPDGVGPIFELGDEELDDEEPDDEEPENKEDSND